MSDWNPLLIEQWANRLGFASTPLFGSDDRDGFLLRDGDVGSFILTVGDHDLIARHAHSWAWSSFVPRTAVLDIKHNCTYIQRWDQKSATVRTGLPTEQEAALLVREFEDERQPVGKSVVEHCLDAFRLVRNKMRETGKGPADSLLAFYATFILASWAPYSIPSRVTNPAKLLLRNKMLTPAAAKHLSVVCESFPFHEAVEFVLDTQSHGHLMYPALTLRHAAGVLFQEAHFEIASESQGTLFLNNSKPARRQSFKHRDAVYTPPSIARTLAHAAVKLCQSSDDPISVLDPACGSGVFLLAASQELSGRRARLRGIDTSGIASQMADLTLRCDQDKRHTFEIDQANSLNLPSWEKPDIILMNPPFTAWEDMDSEDRQLVRDVLGADYHYRADKSLAFIAKALNELKAGSVLATIAPSSLLTSQSAQPLRERLRLDDEFTIELVLHLTGYGTFHSAIVDPACFVIKKVQSHNVRPIVLTSSYREAGATLRSVRTVLDTGDSADSIRRTLPAGRWVFPSSSESETLLDVVSGCPTQISDVFNVREGVRTGNKSVFTLDASVLDEREPTWRASAAFRYEATRGTIRLAKLEKARVVFYPYAEDGSPLFSTESELRNALPFYFEEILYPNMEELENRSWLNGPWWTLSRPRSWQYTFDKRIISGVFCQPGEFALDEIGDFVATQALVWELQDQAAHNSLQMAYIAILNSWEFFNLCCCYSRTMQGGQVECYGHHIAAVPMPNLLQCDKKTLEALTIVGTQMTQGTFPSSDEISTSVAMAYGVSTETLRSLRKEPIDVESEFERLWRWLMRDTKFVSRDDVVRRHPAYARIVMLRELAIPFIEAKHSDGGGQSNRRAHMLKIDTQNY